MLRKFLNYFSKSEEIDNRAKVENPWDDKYMIFEVDVIPNEAGFAYLLNTSRPVGWYEQIQYLCYWNCSLCEVEFLRGFRRSIPRGTWGTWLSDMRINTEAVRGRDAAIEKLTKMANRKYKINFGDDNV